MFRAPCIWRFRAASGTRSFCDPSNPNKTNRKIHGDEYPEWRTSWKDEPGAWKSNFSALSSFMDGSGIFTFMTKFRANKFQESLKRLPEESEVFGQQFISERHETLGPDLATAYFICFRGGSVMFYDNNVWKKLEGKSKDLGLPNVYKEGLLLEKIDCENFKNGGLRYEGLENIGGLRGLKWLSLKKNIHIDDWCMDRLSALTYKTLEYLDISGCPITHRGLGALYRMEKLNMLTLNYYQMTRELEFVCSILEESKPNLLIKFIEMDSDEKS